MKLAFEVGDIEKHIVELHFNQVIGNLKILINKKPVIRDFRMFSESLIISYRFEVGSFEIHKVRIDKIRKALFAGFRKQKYEVYVDEVLIKKCEGF